MRRDQSTTMSPERIQSSTGTTCVAFMPAMKAANVIQAMAQLTNRPPVVMTFAAVWPITFRPSPATIAVNSGRKTMSFRASISRASGWRRRPRWSRVRGRR